MRLLRATLSRALCEPWPIKYPYCLKRKLLFKENKRVADVQTKSLSFNAERDTYPRYTAINTP